MNAPAVDPRLDVYRAAIRARGMKVTPYRMGYWAGVLYSERFKIWSAGARAGRNYTGRPERPPCPYTVNVSIRGWEEGYRRGTK